MRRCPSDVYEAKFDEDYDYDLRNGPRLSRFRMHASGNLQLDGGSTAVLLRPSPTPSCVRPNREYSQVTDALYPGWLVPR